MPEIHRSRTVAADRPRVWSLVADPHNLPRWWPETTRVESVEGEAGSRGQRFTQVLTTRDGRPVRADFRCEEAERGRRLVWEQAIDGTPFEGFMKRASLEIALSEENAGFTSVSLRAKRSLRGLSRLGAPMMRKATGNLLDRALDGLEIAVGGADGS